MVGVGLGTAFEGSTVLVTGHTGFKGSWLSMWLHRLGAEVVGYALEPPSRPSLFEVAQVGDLLTDVRGDVADLARLESVVRRHKPEYLFHLAALPIVRTSYEEPVETFATNVMGLVHLLEAVRRAQHPCTIVVVTSDKCYLNRSWHGYREDDSLGGSDPYSASKAAQEIVTASYRHSYFSPDSGIRLASARAGNVVGGGDWACDRLVPDAIRALSVGDEIVVRNPTATRPWQHVLQPLSGYLVLGATVAAAGGSELAGSWNFGPDGGAHPVSEVADLLVREWGEGSWRAEGEATAPSESDLLALAVDKAQNRLGWRAVWDLDTTIIRTVAWYRREKESRDDPKVIRGLCNDDFSAFESAAADLGVGWFR